MGTLQDKVHHMYDVVKSNFYFCRNDLSVGRESYNASLLFGVMTELNRGNQLLFGDYGGGKTTSSEFLHSLFYSLPLDLVRRSAIRGHPHLTEEKMVGRPHFGVMNTTGEEKVVWQDFVLLHPKIIDEINRIPEPTQNIALNGVDRGDWDYLNASISTGEQPLFATCNYQDGGNVELIAPMLDRFDVSTESKFPGVSDRYYISTHRSLGDVLKSEALTKKAMNAIRTHGSDYDAVQEELKVVSEEFRKSLADQDYISKFEVNDSSGNQLMEVPTLNESELDQIFDEITNKTVSNQGKIYIQMLIAELNISLKYGMRRNNDPIETENGYYLGSLMSNGGNSGRTDQSLMKYAQTLAWLLDSDEVELDHFAAVAPHVLTHRVTWSPDTIKNFQDHKRNTIPGGDSLQFYITKSVLGEGISKRPGFMTRVRESNDQVRTLFELITSEEPVLAQQVLANASADGKGHPIFVDYQFEEFHSQ